ncbi:hypothetical protein NUW54_g13921 [Trametes sanguinea]|uniref:Uncharacterized protein n=1 Tax=Trametes sanguinea TaxID=158606 RepID=A0ACC1MGR9_9APHY|nr:hypothetical protein NUW54_g13921 [Trametes sanguinea]
MASSSAADYINAMTAGASAPSGDDGSNVRFQTPIPPTSGLASMQSPLTDVSSDLNNERPDHGFEGLPGSRDSAGSLPIPGSPSSTMHSLSTSRELLQNHLQSPFDIAPPTHTHHRATDREFTPSATRLASQDVQAIHVRYPPVQMHGSDTRAASRIEQTEGGRHESHPHAGHHPHPPANDGVDTQADNRSSQAGGLAGGWS